MMRLTCIEHQIGCNQLESPAHLVLSLMTFNRHRQTEKEKNSLDSARLRHLARPVP